MIRSLSNREIHFVEQYSTYNDNMIYYSETKSTVEIGEIITYNSSHRFLTPDKINKLKKIMKDFKNERKKLKKLTDDEIKELERETEGALELSLEAIKHESEDV